MDLQQGRCTNIPKVTNPWLNNLDTSILQIYRLKRKRRNKSSQTHRSEHKKGGSETKNAQAADRASERGKIKGQAPVTATGTLIHKSSSTVSKACIEEWPRSNTEGQYTCVRVMKPAKL